MSDLNLALQEMASRADEQLMPDPQTLREQVAPASRRRRRMRTGAWVAAAAAVAGVIGAAVPSLQEDQQAPGPSDGPSVGDRTPGATPTTDFETEPYGEEDGWQEVAFGKGVTWTAVAFAQGSYVAVADTSTALLVDDEDTAAGSVPIWWSGDGRTWARVEDGAGPATGNVWTVIAVDTGFVALAAASDGSTTSWLSEDGRSWQPSDSLPAGFRPYDLVETDVGLVAWGRGRVWVSSDGARTWSSASKEPIWPAVEHAFNPCRIEQVGTRLTAVVLRDGRGSGVTATRWTSEDGVTWRPAGDVATSNPWALCARQDESAYRASGPPGTVAIASADGVYGAYDSSIFFRPAEWGNR